jgi:uncharacterized protein YjbJ (UPF0337 family)
MWNKDEIEGKGKQFKGAVKDKVGEWSNNPKLEEEGEMERSEGNLQETVGTTKRKVKEFARDVKDKLAGD